MAPQRNRRQTLRSPDERELDDAVEVLAFMKSWLPYGGPDSEEVLVEFGLTPAAFGDRLIVAMQSPEAIDRADVSPDLLSEMLRRMGSAAGAHNTH